MTAPPFLRFALLALLAVSGGIAGCRSKESKLPVGLDDGKAALKKGVVVDPIVTGHVVASVGDRSVGPFFSRRGSANGAAGLVGWITVAEGTGRRVVVVPVDGHGVPRAGESIVASVPVDTTSLVVRPVRGPAPGFLLAWTSLTDRGKSLTAVAVGDNGQARAKPVEITRTTDDIPWVDIIPTDRGAACIWAEETRGGDANLVAAALDTDGKVREAPARIARAVVGWHALELPGGVGISFVGAPPIDGRRTDGRSGGSLSFLRLDADAHPIGAPVPVTAKPVVSGDVEVARDGTRLVFAWTDRTTEEPAVSVAAMDEKNLVEGPRRVAEARGGASLLGLASGSAGVAVMFEAPIRRKEESRRLHVARIGERLYLDRPALALDVLGRSTPEIAATATGFAILAAAADCDEGSPACAGAPTVATIFRTDPKVVLLQREALTFQTDPASMGWGMTCEGETCVTLAASSGGAGPGGPSRVRTAYIRPRVNAKASVARLEQPSGEGPHIVDITAVATGESILHLATARLGDTVALASLGRGDRRRTTEEARTGAVPLSTRMVDANGNATPPVVLTPRAVPAGGVAIAPGEKPDDGGAVAWVGKENGESQVHVTRIDKRGRRQQDVQLTTSKGDKTDVTITSAGKGWIVAWVDAREGNGEVYATKVTPELQRISREERITSAPGDASDLVAIANGDAVWLAWADPRESPKDGVADIFVTAVKMHDAKRALDEQRLLPTAAHSRTPHLASGDGAIHVAWIEEAPMGSESPSSSAFGAFWTKLDPNGRPLGRPMRLPLAGDGAATSVALEGGASVRAVVARSMVDAISLDAIDLSASPVRPTSLLALDGPPSLDVSLAIEKDVLFFNDEGPTIADRRARRARIAWTR